jgi:hypothetical protein
MSVAGTKEGLNAGGRTKEDDQESEEKKSGWRLHFHFPFPQRVRMSGSGRRILTRPPSESAISREPSIEYLINQNAANLAAR